MALLTKLAWQIQTEPNRLWVHIFRSKYLQGVDLLTATSYKSGSWAWKGVVEAVTLLKQGACYLLRSGNVGVTAIPWVPTIHNFRPTTKSTNNINLKV